MKKLSFQSIFPSWQIQGSGISQFPFSCFESQNPVIVSPGRKPGCFKSIELRFFLKLFHFFKNTFLVKSTEVFQFFVRQGCNSADSVVRVFHIPKFCKRAVFNRVPKLAAVNRDYQISIVNHFFVIQHGRYIFIPVSSGTEKLQKKRGTVAISASEVPLNTRTTNKYNPRRRWAFTYYSCCTKKLAVFQMQE